jgi:AraC family transcriptional regulator, L-rhamnose operon regulatory protein RhaS
VDQELLAYLRQITDDEREILAGRSTVHKEIYTSDKDLTIDSKKCSLKAS